jgi:hypothetical protein
MDIETLSRELQRLQDTQAICELKYRYLNACDEKLPELVRDCFAPGPVANEGPILNFFVSGSFVR